MLKLILGPAGCGKTSYIMEKLRQDAASGRSGMILLVPEQYSHEAERQLCRLAGDGISLHAEVLSFTRLASRVFAAAGGAAAGFLDGGGRLLVMSRALSACAGRLRVYGGAAGRPEYLAGLIAAMDEFKSCRIGSDKLEEAAEELEGTLGDKLRDMAVITEAYDAVAANIALDPTERLERLAEAVGKSGLARSGVYIDGFTDFTAQELEVLREILKVGDVTLCLTCDGINGTDPVFGASRRAAERLIAMAGPSGCLIENRTGETEGALEFAAQKLFGGGSEKFEGDSSAVELFYAENPMEECCLAAAKTIELLRQGLRLRDISVVARNWQDYEAEAENIFAQYGIPVYMGKKSDILEKPAAAFVTAAMDTVNGGWEYDDIFRCLKTGLWGIDSGDMDVLENYVLKWNIRGSKWTGEKDWDMNPDGLTGEVNDRGRETLALVNRLRREISAPLKTLQEEGKKAETGEEQAKVLYRFMETVGLGEALSKKAGELGDRGELQLRDEYLQLWDILISGLEQCAGILGDTPMGAGEFTRLYKLLLSQYDVGTIPVALDRVNMGEMTRVRRRGTKCLIILGAADDAMPGAAQGSGVFTDQERDKLTEYGLELPDTSEERLYRELNAIYQSVSLPSEKLIMTCPKRGAGGGEKRPSFLMTRLGLILDKNIGMADADFCRTFAPRPCFEMAAKSGVKGRWAAAAESVFAESGELARVRAAADMPADRLQKQEAERLYGKNVNLSASKLEQFGECRFKFFMRYGLRAKPREKAEFSAPEAGTFMHYILENVNRKVQQRGGFAAVSDRECLDMADGYIKKYAREKMGGLEGKSSRFVYLFKRLAKDVHSVVLDMAGELRSSSFNPVSFELHIGRDGDVPPPDAGDGITVDGYIDRVDGWIHEDKLYLRVVDYKTGKKSFSLSDVWYGLGMQMLLYLFALQENGGSYYGMEIVPAGVLYMPARDVLLSMPRDADEETVKKERAKKLKRSGLLLFSSEVIEAMEHGTEPKYIPVKFAKDGSLRSENLATLEQFGKLAGHIEKTLTAIAGELREGKIDAVPYYRSQADNACLYCEFFEACRFDFESGRPRYYTRLKTPEVWRLMDLEEEKCRK